jgi:predicted GNAT superfamily acetyltransferase
VLCLAAGLEYWSDNYKWFAARYDDFLYLDRVVVAERARRLGVGRALYADLHRTANGRWPRVTLEVNVRPANPNSVVFHEALGYEAVGVREDDDGEHAVQMFMRDA